MHALREKLQNHLVRRAAELVDELGEDRSTRLAELLDALEARGREVQAAEERLTDLERRLADVGVVNESLPRLEQLLQVLEERNGRIRDLTADAARTQVATADLRRRVAEAEHGRGELAERIAQLETRLLHSPTPPAKRWAAPAPASRETELLRRETTADAARAVAERERARIAHLETQLDARERELRDGERGLAERADELERRLATVVADAELRTAALERRERELQQEATRIAQLERELARHVTEAQAALAASRSV